MNETNEGKYAEQRSPSLPQNYFPTLLPLPPHSLSLPLSPSPSISLSLSPLVGERCVSPWSACGRPPAPSGEGHAVSRGPVHLCGDQHARRGQERLSRTR